MLGGYDLRLKVLIIGRVSFCLRFCCLNVDFRDYDRLFEGGATYTQMLLVLSIMVI